MSKPLYIPKNNVSIKWSTTEDRGSLVINGVDYSTQVTDVSVSVGRGDGHAVPQVHVTFPVDGELNIELDGAEVENCYEATDPKMCATCARESGGAK